MLAKKYRSEVVDLLNTIVGIYTVSFQSKGRPYKFLPGQFLHLSIDSEYDGIGQWPESRCFSIQSNPDDEIVKITYSVKGTYTQLMEKSIKVGNEVWLKMPYGELFQQPHNKSKSVFIAGGTGVTPYLSLFSHKSFNDYINPKIYLGFRSQSYNLYEKELEEISSGSAIVNTYFQDIDGVIDIKSIFEENGVDSNYFISGPPDMIKTLKNFLVNNGATSNSVLTDDWE